MEYIINEGSGLVVIAIDKSGITPGNQNTLVMLTLSEGTATGKPHPLYMYPSKSNSKKFYKLCNFCHKFSYKIKILLSIEYS